MSTREFLNPRDLMFWLYEVGASDELSHHPQFAEFGRAEFESMLDAVTEFSDAEFEGLAAELDENEPRFDGERVWNHERLKPALDAYSQAGYFSAPFPAELGGIDLPYCHAMALGLPVSASLGTGYGYLQLTAAAANMLAIMGNEAQKQKYLPKLVAGQWYGTMMLSEPQAGSSVGDIRTRAVLQSDGHYHLSGSKMWISGGDQEMSENIIHMVLAKIVDENGQIQPGTRGISLFIVPKYQLNDDGSLGRRNGVRLSGINHKMGCRGIVNTVPVLGGDDQPCVGELVGEPGKGLMAMFHMMNEMRVSVGSSAAQFAYLGYRYSLGYAQERLQGRSLHDADPSKPQIPIIEHADVKRMLLQQKALSEGAMALCFFAGELIDRASMLEDAQERSENSQLLAILTPIVKTWPSVWGLHSNYLAMQALGGYGYTREYPLERLYRDNRLNEIHEGTTGIQSLDLLGRKVPMQDGAAFKLLVTRIRNCARESASVDGLQEFSQRLNEAVERLVKTTEVLLGEAAAGRTDSFLGNSATYLDMCGHTVVAWMWLRCALQASRALPAAAEVDKAFYQGKLRACQYFFRAELPKTHAQAELLQSLDDTCRMAEVDEF